MRHPDPIIQQFIAFYEHQQAGGDPDLRAWVQLAEEAALHAFGEKGEQIGRGWAGQVAVSWDLTDLAVPIAAYEFVRYLTAGKTPAAWSGPTPWRELAEKTKSDEWKRLSALRIEVSALSAMNRPESDERYVVRVAGTGSYQVTDSYGLENLLTKLREIAARHTIEPDLIWIARHVGETVDGPCVGTLPQFPADLRVVE